MSQASKFILMGICGLAFLGACQMTTEQSGVICPEGFVDTINIGMGEPSICCPLGTTGQDGFCVDTPNEFSPQPTEFPAPNTIVTDGVEPKAEASNQDATSDTETQTTVSKEAGVITPGEPVQETEQKAVSTPTEEMVYLTAPNGKGSAYCPARANSLAWNGTEFKCCGYGMIATSIPSRDESICCPTGTLNARWIGKEGLDFECCPAGTIEVKNEGEGDKYLCCKKGQIGKNGECKDKTELAKEGKVLLTALGGKGQAYCPDSANSLAWNSSEFQCCGKGMKATEVASRGDSICCPDKATAARWVGKKWNDFECCPAGTVEVKNLGEGDKYICCPAGNKALNGECLALK